MPSLKDQLAILSDPKPVDFDPEDFERFDPEIEDKKSFDDILAKEHYLKNGKSSLRDDGIVLNSKKYSGSRISRKKLENGLNETKQNDKENSEEDESEDMSSNSSSDISDLNESDVDSVSGSVSNASEYSESDDDDPVRFQSSNTDDNEMRNKFTKLLKEEQKNLVSQLAESAQQDAIKGEAVQHQMNIYEKILDARIQAQKPIAASNTLPLNYEDFKSLETDSTEELMAKAKKSVYKLLNNISDLRVKLMKTDGVVNDDEECKISHKRKYESALGNATKLDSQLAEYRDRVLSKWSRKVQASSGSSSLQSSKFKAFNQTSDVQVKSVLADMERLVKRTKLNRSNYKRLGAHIVDEQAAPTNEDDHIFDDTDFYQMLLRDLVDKRMADNQISMGMKWTVTKTKMKKSIDTRASKGRKLRYHVQEKIQGFDAPHHVLTWTDEQADDLFASLLGQRLQVNEEEPQSEDELPEVENDGLAIFG